MLSNKYFQNKTIKIWGATVSLLLAQPFICCKSNPGRKLQREKLLLIRGDLA
jgi:hypothetical protein